MITTIRDEIILRLTEFRTISSLGSLEQGLKRLGIPCKRTTLHDSIVRLQEQGCLRSTGRGLWVLTVAGKDGLRQLVEMRRRVVDVG